MKHHCIRIFENYMLAHIVLGRLQNEFVTCYLQDEMTHTLGPFLSTPLGGIKLMVAEQHIERAKALLEEYDRAGEY